MPQPESLISNPTNEEIVDCIQHPVGTWRPNPNDPYVYISFSPTKLIKAYQSLDPELKANAERLKLSRLDKTKVKAYKKLIRKEWEERAGYPVKFLDPNTPAAEVLNKNILFIISTEDSTANAGHTFVPMINGQIVMSYIVLKNLPNAKVTRADKYIFLHETAHALTLMKHHKPHHSMDVGPYCDIPCDATIMAYGEDCSSEDQKNKLYSYMYKHPEETTINSSIAVISEMPLRLSEMDILACKRYLARWNEANKILEETDKKVANTQQDFKKIEEKIERLESTLITLRTSINVDLNLFFPANEVDVLQKLPKIAEDTINNIKKSVKQLSASDFKQLTIDKLSSIQEYLKLLDENINNMEVSIREALRKMPDEKDRKIVGIQQGFKKIEERMRELENALISLKTNMNVDLNQFFPASEVDVIQKIPKVADDTIKKMRDTIKQLSGPHLKHLSNDILTDIQKHLKSFDENINTMGDTIKKTQNYLQSRQNNSVFAYFMNLKNNIIHSINDYYERLVTAIWEYPASVIEDCPNYFTPKIVIVDDENKDDEKENAPQQATREELMIDLSLGLNNTQVANHFASLFTLAPVCGNVSPLPLMLPANVTR